MFYKTRKLVEYLKEGNLQLFDIHSTSDADILRHNENINGFTLKSVIIINNTASIEVVYIIAQCTNIMKHEQMISLMNELNCDRQLKYCMRTDGLVTASFNYYADDNDFNADALLSLYAVFMKTFNDNNDINRIMRLIWG